MAKIVDKFLEQNPDVPKRAIENKVFEMSVKEKRKSDATKVKSLCNYWMPLLTSFLKL